MTEPKDIIVTIDFMDCKDWASNIYGYVHGHRAAHVGMRSEWFQYIFPQENKPLKIRDSGVIYYHFEVLHAIHMIGQVTDPDWLNKLEGRTVDSRFWRLITEPIYVFHDFGINVQPPKRTICVDIIADAMRMIGINTRARTVNGLYRELLTHPLRVG